MRVAVKVTQLGKLGEDVVVSAAEIVPHVTAEEYVGRLTEVFTET